MSILRATRYHLTIAAVLTAAFSQLTAQVKLPAYPDSLFTTYYHQRCSLFSSLPVTSNDIVFIGNSITDGAEWSELFNDIHIKNRGISGDITAGIINRIADVAKRKPAAVFLMAGINDLARNTSPDSIVKNIVLVADYLHYNSPATRMYVQSLLPVNDSFGKFSGHTSKGAQVKQVNALLQAAAAAHFFRYIDLHSFFCDANGKLDKKFTNDGLHLCGDGYLLWKHLVYPYVYGLQEKPSLIPQPVQLQWIKGFFSLPNCRSLLVQQKGLENETVQLQEMLRQFGWNIELTANAETAGSCIELHTGSNELQNKNEEAYELEVSEKKILLTARAPHGIFNAIQTLRQLLRDGTMADACKITDAPAFSWRGYMIDVGRNYMSPALLKQQVEVMGRYKLNVFHFHATEDIAWRFAIAQYPQLTAPENMLRNKGMYYTPAEIKELIEYCKQRHIIFLPEIDMPGHSQAFTRAMKTGMQSDTGILYLKNILKEFCTAYDVPYIHIGADEVKITNKNFIPLITAYIDSLGKKTVGWQPGGNFSDNTIRQLWMDDRAHLSSNGNIRYVDSRHLYLNHMDPLEAVVTIFNRKIGDKDCADKTLLGGTICVWPDRAVARESDVLKMNPVYPSMLAFAERSWQGGGTTGWIANVSDGDTNAFRNFENHLLDHRQQYFKDKPFAYVKQTGLQWKLYGPFDNGGDVTRQFSPEKKSGNENIGYSKTVTGGTVVLRHWWAPLIKGAIDSARENTTWYATTTIWSDEAKEGKFWIGFNNLSRSPATSTPLQNEWNNSGDAVWVNGKPVPPPQWKRAGQAGNAEIPLTDEGYEYREPAVIPLQKGWNKVLVKIPIASFRGKDWQHPQKWMFTFIRVDE